MQTTFNAEFDAKLNAWYFDYYGDWIVLDARDKAHATELMDEFLMTFGNDAENGMEG